MSQRFDEHGYALSDIHDTDDLAKRTPSNLRPVQLLKSDPAVYAMVDDRTFDPAVYVELSAAEQDVARKVLEALAAAEA